MSLFQYWKFHFKTVDTDMQSFYFIFKIPLKCTTTPGVLSMSN